MSEYNSYGGKYSGILTKKLKNCDLAFYVTFRDIESKVRRKKVGVAPVMTKRKALDCLNEIRQEVEAKKELAKNPNSPIPKILRKKVDKQVYTLNDLAEYYFHENKSKSKRAMQNKYNYHFSDEAFVNKNIHLITENDIEDFILKKSKQRADNRRSNSSNITKLHEQGFLPKRKRKSKALNLSLEEREKQEYENNLVRIKELERKIESKNATWREENKIKVLKERNRVLEYRFSPESKKKLLKDKTLGVDELNSLLGLLSRKSIKELLLMASTIITYANTHKHLNIFNQFHILRGNKNYIGVNNVKPRYLTKEEIKSYLKEIKKVTYDNPEVHNYLYLISLLALSTAARRDTILNIKIEDIDLENNNIQLRNFKTEHNFTSSIASPVIKTELIRVINNREPSKFLFEGSSGVAITAFPPKMKEVLDYTVNCNRSYLNYLTIKEFRNTVASHLAMNGTSIAHIAQVLDHASTRTTEIYSQLAPSTAKDDVSSFVNGFLED
ncbi:tyrosine-type recombinase/integrase [Sulfurimonas sp.]